MTPACRHGIAVTAAWFLVGIGPHLSLMEEGGGLRAQQPAQAKSSAPGELEVLQLRPNFYLIAGAGGHIGVQVGDDGVVVVDAGSAARADAVVAAIKKLTAAAHSIRHQYQRRCGSCRRQRGVAKAGQTLFTNPGSIGLPGNFIAGAASILSVRMC